MDEKTKTGKTYDAPDIEFEHPGNGPEDGNGALYRLASRTDLDSVMAALSIIIHEYEKTRTGGLQRKTCRLALDWLATLKHRLDNANAKLDAIRVTEYEAGCANSDGKLVPGTEHVMYMAYSTDIISDELAEHVLSSGMHYNDPRVVVLDPIQAAALFPALRERSEEDAKNQA